MSKGNIIKPQRFKLLWFHVEILIGLIDIPVKHADSELPFRSFNLLAQSACVKGHRTLILPRTPTTETPGLLQFQTTVFGIHPVHMGRPINECADIIAWILPDRDCLP